MKPTIVCTAPLHFLPEIRSALEEAFSVVHAFNEAKEKVATHLAPARGLLLNPGAPYRIDRPFLEKAPNLEIIVTPSTGQDHIDLDYCREHRIAVKSLRGREEIIQEIHASAEFSFALLLAMIKKLPAAVNTALQGQWREVEDSLRGIELNGKHVGLVGYGRIGKKMSRYLNAFGTVVTAYDPHVRIQDPWVEQVASLEILLGGADIVCLHVHLDPETRGLFDKKTFSLMKKGSYFLNTARGGLVVEEDLIAALESGHLRAAAVDVIEGEQGPDIRNNRLIQYAKSHPRLMITPHIAGLTVDSQRKAARFALNELKAHFHL